MRQATTPQTIGDLQSCTDVLKLKSVRKALFICGVISSLLYIAIDIVASMRYPGYSYINQAFSELLAIGSPVRPFMLPFESLYNVLVIAFAAGVWTVAGRNRNLHITSVMLLAYGVSSLAGPYVPMHVRGSEGSLTDVLHIVDTIAMVLSVLLAMGFGAAALGKRFRLFSIATMLMVVLFGVWSGTQGSQMAAGLPTPWLGVMERMNIYPIMLWVLALGAVLLRAENR